MKYLGSEEASILAVHLFSATFLSIFHTHLISITDLKEVRLSTATHNTEEKCFRVLYLSKHL